MLACAWIVAFFPVLANTTLGLNSVDHNLADLFRLYGASRAAGAACGSSCRRRCLTSSAGLKIAGGLSLIGAVVAEIAAGSAGAGSGLAYRIAESGYRLNIPRMFAALLLLSVAGIVIFFVAVAAVVPGAAPLARERGGARRCDLPDAANRTAMPSSRHDRDDFDQAAMQARTPARPRSRRAPAAFRSSASGSNANQRSWPKCRSVDLAEQDVQREPHREIEDHADHRRGDRRQRPGEPAIAAQVLDERRAGKDPQQRRRERHPGRHRGAEHGRDQRRERRGIAESRQEANELGHQDERPRRGLGKAEAVDHLGRVIQ